MLNKAMGIIVAILLGLSWVDAYHYNYYSHNVAQDKPAWFSNAIPTKFHWFNPASRAVDGNTHSHYNLWGCAGSNLGITNPWFAVDLLDEYDIHEVVIYNRGFDYMVKGNIRKHRIQYAMKNVEIQAGRTLSSMKRCSMRHGALKFGTVTRFHCRARGIRYVRVISHAKIVLQICELKVMGHPSGDYDESLIVSNGKPATQSGNYVGRFKASKAVDGNPSPVWATAAHTKLRTGPWWQVDLRDQFFIDRIVVFAAPANVWRLQALLVETRQGRRGKFRMYNTLKRLPVPRDIFIFRHHRLHHPKARFVKLSLPRIRTWLHVAEVRVYGWRA